MIHIGKKIEEIVRLKRFSIVEFARMINTTRNNVYNIFSRESIDTELLRKIGNILDYDFFLLISKSNKLPVEITGNTSQNNLNIEMLDEPNLKDVVVLLQKEIEHLHDRLSEKEEMINLFKKVENFSK